MKALLLLSFLCAAFLLAGCSAPPEGGSSMPWARPEPWETQGRMTPGVNF